MKYRIKESKNIFPCTVYMENQDYDEAYYYLDTPEYGLSWRSFDDIEQEDVENYKYIIKNTADLRKAIDDLEEDFIYGYGAKYFKLSGNYIEDLLDRGETLVHVSNVDSKDTVFIIKVEPAQNVELALAESFEKTIKNLQREGLFENVSSFDLNFNGKGINIKLNESRLGNRYESFKKRSNLKENETDEVTYMQDFSIEDYGDTSEAEEAAAELGIDLTFYEGTGNLGMDEICASGPSEEVLKEFLYDWGFIESYSDFEDGVWD